MRRGSSGHPQVPAPVDVDGDVSELDPLDPFDAASPELDPPEAVPPELDSLELDPDADSLELDPPEPDSPELDPPELDSPEPDPSELAPPEAASPPFDGPLDRFFAEAAEDRLSFLAQPLPLKWIVGGANARLTRPSQSGHW